jgi:hypothetical protein
MIKYPKKSQLVELTDGVGASEKSYSRLPLHDRPEDSFQCMVMVMKALSSSCFHHWPRSERKVLYAYIGYSIIIDVIEAGQCKAITLSPACPVVLLTDGEIRRVRNPTSEPSIYLEAREGDYMSDRYVNISDLPNNLNQRELR